MTRPIRRHYVLPIRPGTDPALTDQLIDVLGEADRFIPGLLDSSAALDRHSSTVLWENSFVDEAAYTGPYMEHPYHVAAIDDFLMPDSPTAVVGRSFAVRFHTDDLTQPLRSGIRRLVLLSLDDSLADAVAAIASNPTEMATSVLAADDVGWASAKGRTWTHIWEQGFADDAQLERHLASPTASTPDHLRSLGVAEECVAVFTCEFELKASDEQNPPPMPPDDRPVLYALSHRVASADVDTLTTLLESRYDPFMAEHDAPLVRRHRTVAGGYGSVEIESVWQLESLAAYNQLRGSLATAAGWGQFVRDATPLVVGGRRRFYRLDQ